MHPENGKKMLFATDLDGTLLYGGDDMGREDTRALEALENMGVIRVIATGRSLFSIRKALEGAVLPADYMVLSSGAGIIDCSTGDYVKTNNLDKFMTSRLVELLFRLNLDFCVQSPVPDNHFFTYRYSSGRNSDMERRIRLYRGFCSPLEPREGLGASAQVIVIEPPGPGIGILHGRLEEILGGEYTVIRTTSPLDGESLWIEIFPDGVSKSDGVRWIAGEHGICQDDTAAVGNDYNDMDLLEWAGIPFVVNSAPDVLIEKFKRVVPAGEGAVARAARYWLIERGILDPVSVWPREEGPAGPAPEPPGRLSV